jgi:hypothetical protein
MFKCSIITCSLFVLLPASITGMVFGQQPIPPMPPKIERTRKITFPSDPHLVAHFSAQHIEDGPETPNRRDAVSISVERDGKTLAKFGIITSGEVLFEDVVDIRGQQWILFASISTYAGGQFLLCRFDGSRIVDSCCSFQGSNFAYEKYPNGDLKIIISSTDNGEGTPQVIRWDGTSTSLDEPGEHEALVHLIQEANADVESYRPSGPFPPVGLLHDCSCVLQAEATVGDPTVGLQVCATARKHIQDWSNCQPNWTGCSPGRGQGLLDLLDSRVNQMMMMNPAYLKLSGKPKG